MLGGDPRNVVLIGTVGSAQAINAAYAQGKPSHYFAFLENIVAINGVDNEGGISARIRSQNNI